VTQGFRQKGRCACRAGAGSGGRTAESPLPSEARHLPLLAQPGARPQGARRTPLPHAPRRALRWQRGGRRSRSGTGPRKRSRTLRFSTSTAHASKAIRTSHLPAPGRKGVLGFGAAGAPGSLLPGCDSSTNPSESGSDGRFPLHLLPGTTPRGLTLTGAPGQVEIGGRMTAPGWLLNQQIPSPLLRVRGGIAGLLLVDSSDAATGNRSADILAKTLEIHAEDDQLFENARFAQATIPGALASCASRAGGTSWRWHESSTANAYTLTSGRRAPLRVPESPPPSRPRGPVHRSHRCTRWLRRSSRSPQLESPRERQSVWDPESR